MNSWDSGDCTNPPVGNMYSGDSPRCAWSNFKNQKVCTRSCWENGFPLSASTDCSAFDCTGDACLGAAGNGVAYAELQVCGREKEYMRYDVALARCGAESMRICHAETTILGNCGPTGQENRVWTTNACSQEIAVNADGLVSEQTGTASTADKSNRNYFAVHWDNGVYPTPADGCHGARGCAGSTRVHRCSSVRGTPSLCQWYFSKGFR